MNHTDTDTSSKLKDGRMVNWIFVQDTEAAIREVLWKKVFSKISPSHRLQISPNLKVTYYFFLLPDLNILDTTFAERTCYLFFSAQKMKFSIEDFFRKCDRIHRNLRIWSHLLKNPQKKTSFFVQCLLIKIYSYKLVQVQHNSSETKFIH